MFKATRELIKARQKHTNYVVEVTRVKAVGGGKENACFQNACAYKEKNRGSTVVSGWIINKFDTKTNSTAIVQHYWNVNEFGKHVDTTPLFDNVVEYVIDVDISIFAQEHYEEIESCVSASLLLCNGYFSTIDKDEYGMHVKYVSKLTTANLFKLFTT